VWSAEAGERLHFADAASGLDYDYDYELAPRDQGPPLARAAADAPPASLNDNGESPALLHRYEMSAGRA
jgi:hypothetical protein